MTRATRGLRWRPRGGRTLLPVPYGRQGLRKDTVAGVALFAVLVPAGMGYAEAAGLPAVTGLYASILPLLVYAAIGPSRTLIVGPDSSLAPLIAAAVVGLSGGDPDRLIALGSLLGVLTGLVCIGGGLLRAGRVTDLLAVPIRYGFVNGIALTIAVSQLATMAGISYTSDFIPNRIWELGSSLLSGDFVRPSLLVGGIAVIAIVVGLRLRPEVPVSVLVVIGSMVLTAVASLESRGVATVGVLPTGIPATPWFKLQWTDVTTLLPSAVAIALVAAADTTVLSRTLAARRHEEVDTDAELVALGAGSCAAGLVQGFPISASFSRSSVAESVGVRSQVAGVVAAALLTVLLFVGGEIFKYLPRSVLAAVVLVAALRLVEIRPVIRLYRSDRGAFVQSLIAFVAVAVLGALPGLGVAVVIAVVVFFQKAWNPYSTELVRVAGLKGYHDVSRHPEGRAVPGLVLFRFDAPLFFANAGGFQSDIRSIVESHHGVNRIVVTAEPITDVDATAAEMLGALYAELRREGVELEFAEVKGVVRDRMERYGLVRLIGPERFHRTVGQAVRSYVNDYDIDWVDWEDQPESWPSPGEEEER